ncbi:hypothetical protein NPIL_642301 [Nephila pilipes]|uniref:Uncharacterized protein n=1 Tax=Nephila pilipes TaxID=299642 RepID=A0A8X6PSE1_NEPPI|nr:hypothetical protein NPIL_642301 [Nephila pilipes]
MVNFTSFLMCEVKDWSRIYQDDGSSTKFNNLKASCSSGPIESNQEVSFCQSVRPKHNEDTTSALSRVFFCFYSANNQDRIPPRGPWSMVCGLVVYLLIRVVGPPGIGCIAWAADVNFRSLDVIEPTLIDDSCWDVGCRYSNIPLAGGT